MLWTAAEGLKYLYEDMTNIFKHSFYFLNLEVVSIKTAAHLFLELKVEQSNGFSLCSS